MATRVQGTSTIRAPKMESLLMGVDASQRAQLLLIADTSKGSLVPILEVFQFTDWWSPRYSREDAKGGWGCKQERTTTSQPPYQSLPIPV